MSEIIENILANMFAYFVMFMIWMLVTLYLLLEGL